MENRSLTRYAWLSVAAALLTILLKVGAFALTGSVGLLSDAMEGGVNLTAAIIALFTLKTVERPPDATHEYGHDKAGYFSAGIEGTLILVAAIAILAASINRLLHPAPIENPDIGLFIAGAAALVNLVVGQILIRTGKQHRSITLEADGHHLMSDVWSSAGVMVGVGLAVFTGLEWLDPVVGLAVGVKIGYEGLRIMHHAASGLMDPAIPPQERAVLEEILDEFGREWGVEWHGLRTRQSGARRFINVHILAPPEWTVQQAHDLSEALEAAVRERMRGVIMFTHVEPLGDPAALGDGALDHQLWLEG
ncbi:MAG: cation transporter [Chloroflexi bacterium]|nr:cation transporter [Chloroflexota bacterium]